MSKLSNRITVMLLSGMLVIGSVPGSVLAASTDVASGQISEAAEDVLTEDTSEAPAAAGETSEAGEDVLAEDTSEAPAAAGETSEAGEDVFTEGTSEVPVDAGETFETAKEVLTVEPSEAPIEMLEKAIPQRNQRKRKRKNSIIPSPSMPTADSLKMNGMTPWVIQFSRRKW